MEIKALLDRLESLAVSNAGKQRKLDQQKRMIRLLREKVYEQADTIHFLKEECGDLTGQVYRLEGQLAMNTFAAPASACCAPADLVPDEDGTGHDRQRVANGADKFFT